MPGYWTMEVLLEFFQNSIFSVVIVCMLIHFGLTKNLFSTQTVTHTLISFLFAFIWGCIWGFLNWSLIEFNSLIASLIAPQQKMLTISLIYSGRTSLWLLSIGGFYMFRQLVFQQGFNNNLILSFSATLFISWVTQFLAWYGVGENILFIIAYFGTAFAAGLLYKLISKSRYFVWAYLVTIIYSQIGPVVEAEKLGPFIFVIFILLIVAGTQVSNFIKFGPWREITLD